ncbi:unnamed protein product [Polarella glacialis]|uniref:Sphingolipid delta4-desaturase N-terminal domain-containing protein n=1 Tax=Polarella glacialis TaxID=89957 RepID=A0A813L8B5_POLGL|nr:unnamed protein product [Polarella glacialis]
MGRSAGKAAEVAGEVAGAKIGKDFFRSQTDEPHAIRRMEILKKHPEIKTLMGYEWKTKYIVAATVALQVFMAWLTLEWRWPAYLAALYVVGGTANHSLFLAIHELAHNLGSKTMKATSSLACLPTFPLDGPTRYQGVDGVDCDIPTRLEGWLVTTTATGYWDHAARKVIFMFFQIFAYALRPVMVKPDLVTNDRWMLLNYAVQFSFDGLMAYWLGPRVVLYFLLSTFFAGSIHPTAGHFIAEHYVFEGETETYSYYGTLNRLAYNVGYHNEHHDFPNIPWSNLPKVREMAPEYFNNLPQCASWTGVIWRYIFDDSISPFSRVKRQDKRA